MIARARAVFAANPLAWSIALASVVWSFFS